MSLLFRHARAKGVAVRVALTLSLALSLCTGCNPPPPASDTRNKQEGRSLDDYQALVATAFAKTFSAKRLEPWSLETQDQLEASHQALNLNLPSAKQPSWVPVSWAIVERLNPRHGWIQSLREQVAELNHTRNEIRDQLKTLSGDLIKARVLVQRQFAEMKWEAIVIEEGGGYRGRAVIIAHPDAVNVLKLHGRITDDVQLCYSGNEPVEVRQNTAYGALPPRTEYVRHYTLPTVALTSLRGQLTALEPQLHQAEAELQRAESQVRSAYRALPLSWPQSEEPRP